MLRFFILRMLKKMPLCLFQADARYALRFKMPLRQRCRVLFPQNADAFYYCRHIFHYLVMIILPLPGIFMPLKHAMPATHFFIAARLFTLAFSLHAPR